MIPWCITGRIAAGEGRFNANNEVVINTETKAVKVTKKGVYFAFRDQGACISIMAVKVRRDNTYIIIYNNNCMHVHLL